MQYDYIIDNLQNLIKHKITQKDVGDALGITKQAIGNKKNDGYCFQNYEIEKIKNFVIKKYAEHNLSNIDNSKNSIAVTYLPDIYLSAGFGIENYYENQEKMIIDAALLISEKGNKINPDFCKIVRISGNSMSPEYRHGDRVIIDENDKELSDGQIFAFQYEGKCYVKEINLMGKKIKCISLNKDYDPFYINENEEITVIGRILPRIRL